MFVTCAIVFIAALALVCYSLRKIIYISRKKHLFDEPTEDRKIHLKKTPNLGGIAIFASVMFTCCFFLPFAKIPHLNYVIAAAFIMFIVGLTDDLVGMNPTKKILSQVVTALIVTIATDLRFTSFHGFFALHEMPYILSIALSTLFILLMINAFNLIDGINCLAGSIALLAFTTFSFLFWQMNEPAYLIVSVAMCGCLAGFLYYNRTPSRIFMGDTGSLFLGFVVAIFAIHIIESNKSNNAQQSVYIIQSVPALIFSILIIPIFDTLRVFSIRIFNRASPFKADRNHIHHRLIDLNFSHLQSTAILVSFTLVCVLFVLLFSNWRIDVLFICIAALTIFCNWVLGGALARKVQSETKPEETLSTITTVKFFTGHVQDVSSPKNKISE